MEKKTKLTISGSAKKTIKNIAIAKTQGKNSVVIEKRPNKFINKSGSLKSNTSKSKTTSSFTRGTSNKPIFSSKSPPVTNDFERRKLAEQRATKRLKGDDDNKDKKVTKSGSKEFVELLQDLTDSLIDFHFLGVSASAWSVDTQKSKLAQNLAKSQASDMGCGPSPFSIGKLHKKASVE